MKDGLGRSGAGSAASGCASGTVEVYPAPAGLPAPSDFTVRVNGCPVCLYDVGVRDGMAPVASFGMSGTVTVEVAAVEAVHSAEVRPRSYGIRTVIDGNTIRFTLTEPRKVVLELNGRRNRALHVFANAMEDNPPGPDDPDVTYFGPGVHQAGDIRLKNGTSVYLAPGAHVYGRILGVNVRDVKIRGRGVLDGSRNGRSNLVNLGGCSNLELSGLTLVDSRSWVCFVHGNSRNVVIDNIKIINRYGGGTDGIDIVSSQDVTINDCYIRDCDDNIALKAFATGGEGQAGDVRRVRVTRCVIWSDGCRSIQTGIETRCEAIEDVVFQDIDIIHHLDITHPVLSIAEGDRAVIRNVRFEDIRIEDACGSPLIDLWVGKSYYSRDAERGHLNGIHFKNISLTGGPAPRVISTWMPYADGRLIGIYGFDDAHAVEDVTIENLHVGGRYVARAEDADIPVCGFARRIRFMPPADGSPVASFTTAPDCPPGVGESVLFDASGSFAQGSKVVSYRWDFGDGYSAEGQAVSHAYAAPGHYAVQLMVRDEAGRGSQVCAVLSVFVLREPENPTGLTGGLNYHLYAGRFNLRRKDALADLTPVKTGHTDGWNMHLSDADEPQAACLEGYIDVPLTGVYTFFLDRAETRLFIGDQSVAEAHWLIGSATDCGRAGLKQGKHRVALWSSSPDLRNLSLEWQGPGIACQPIPAFHFCCCA